MSQEPVTTQPDSLDHLNGLIERVTFHNGETGFAVLQVKVRGLKDLVPVLGTLPEVNAGEWIDAQGRWLIDREYGRQFRSTSLRTAPPNTAEGMTKYLASGLIKGIGPALAGRLVDAFALKVFEVIEQTPRRLLDVDGIGKGRQGKIVAAWNDQKIVREIMVFLHSHGVSTSRAFRIYKTYGEDAIAKVQADPYQLARDIRGIGFKTADQIAEKLGIGKHSDLRARAGVEFVLQELTEDGHCAYPHAKLAKHAQTMLDIPPEIIEAAVAHGIAERRLVEGPDSDGTPLIYLAGFEFAERMLAENLIALSRGQHPCPPVDVEKAVPWVEGKIGFVLAAAQREAVGLATRSKVMVITGGPGVGKTTLVNAILQVFKAKKLEIVLCAPTGRAAKRMCETTGQEAKTIHRLLEFDPKDGGFKRNRDNPLEGDIFIVDETSMVDLMLAHQLIRAVPASAGLILVGDVDQLPSVGPGSVLRDIIDSGVIPVCRLTEVFRQAAQSAIITNAHRINHGQHPLYPQGKVQDVGQADFYFFPADEPEEAVKQIIRLVQQAIPQRFHLDAIEDIQVLTPMQRGELGARNLNLLLQTALNPTGPSVERYGWKFRVGDKVMQTVNNYEKDTFNGDIGRISRIDEVEQEITVRYEDRPVVYDFRELDELQASYAVTVHKSQGSEYPVVVVPIHTQHYMMLQRNLLYTAVTRGKKLVILVGTKKAIAIAVKRMESGKRITTLKQRLTERAASSPKTPSG
jgi:exodeoxyribonuclease V alpha subunit